MRMIVEDSFRELFPDAVIGVVVAHGIDNRRGEDAARALLNERSIAAAASLGETDLATRPAVAVWRDAYREFGLKPSRYRSGIEGLLRSARGEGVRSINPLVDCYNAVSLKHLLPCGGEDLAAIAGDLRLTRAAGNEPFVPLGANENLSPEPGEVIYADDVGVVCRAWNWREAERTKLTAATTGAVLVIEALPPRSADEVGAACEELAALVARHLQGRCRIVLLGSNERYETSLDD